MSRTFFFIFAPAKSRVERRLPRRVALLLCLALLVLCGCDRGRQTAPPAGTPIPAPQPPQPGATPRPGEQMYDPTGNAAVGKAGLPHSLGPDVTAGEIEQYRQTVREAASRRAPLSGLFRQASQTRIFIDVLRLKASDVVVNLDAGLGALETAALESEAPFAAWYALDTDEREVDFLAFLLAQSNAAGRERIVPRPAGRDDLALPPAAADVIILPEATFYLPKEARGEPFDIHRDTQAFLESTSRALKKNGRLHVFARLRPDETRDLDRLIPLVFEGLNMKQEKQETISPEEEKTDRFTHHVFVKGESPR